MPGWNHAVLYGYFIILLVLATYGAHRYQLLHWFYRGRRKVPVAKAQWDELPVVTVQLPLFNEATVVERLLDCVAQLDYPRDSLEIQVLDDSTDETQDLAKRKVDALRETGLDIRYLHREDRTGFKAGALEAGLRSARGPFVAIFDADFLPNPDFLLRSIHHFTDEKVGMVQSRWEHLNRDYSLLTRLQSMLLDGHFVIEHTARNRSGRFFNFNGTAGIWRRTAIDTAGGWQHDTITEDLDLSYRAQMEGWQFVYLMEETAPAELPVEMSAFKTQQHRWAKGSIQTARKILPRIWRSDVPFKVKSEATFHLTANCAYPLLLVMCLLMLPAFRVRLTLGEGTALGKAFDASVFVLATMSVFSFYVAAQKAVDKGWWKSLRFLPSLMALGIGLAVNNSRAVIEALMSHESPFVRTPKYNVTTQKASDGPKRRYRGLAHWMVAVELFFGVYVSLIVGQAVYHQLWVMTFFLTLFAAGFFYVGLGSLSGMWNRGRVRPAPLSSVPPAGDESPAGQQAVSAT